VLLADDVCSHYFVFLVIIRPTYNDKQTQDRQYWNRKGPDPDPKSRDWSGVSDPRVRDG